MVNTVQLIVCDCKTYDLWQTFPCERFSVFQGLDQYQVLSVSPCRSLHWAAVHSCCRLGYKGGIK